jgi:hypothetical protein
LEGNRTLTDLREQFPILDIDRTVELCAELGVHHKYRGAFPEPFTIDLLATYSTSTGFENIAYSIKTPEDAANPATRLRLKVEHLWCRENGISWKLVDTSSFDAVLLSNLRFLRGWFRHRIDPDYHSANMFADQFLNCYATSEHLDSIIILASRKLRIDLATAHNLFRYCGWHDMIKVSLIDHISLDRPLVLRHEQ